MHAAKFITVLGLAIALTANTRATKAADRPTVIKLDYAYYNPISLVLKDKKWLDEDLARDGIEIKWVHSLGSNKSLELLNSKSADFGSTAGVAAFIAKANGNPVKTIYVCSKPEWTALVVANGSPITKVEQLKGKKVAVTRGTDPFVFLARSLHEAGLSIKDIELVSLQHPDGKNALLRGYVDAWSGLDPLMAQAEVDSQARLLYRNPSFITYGVLNVREEFARDYPDDVVRVLKAYEKARIWAVQHPAEYQKLFASAAKLNPAVATRVLERTDLKDPVVGTAQKKAISAAGDVLKQSGVIPASTDVPKLVDELIDPQYIRKISR